MSDKKEMKLKDVPVGVRFKLPGLSYYILKTEKMQFANPEQLVEIKL